MSEVYTLPRRRVARVTSPEDRPLARVEGIHREWGLF